MPAAKRTRTEWISLIEEMKASGLTQPEWCKTRGINYKTMRSMKDKIDNEGKRNHEPEESPGKTTATIPRFVQLPVAQTQGADRFGRGPVLTITIRDGIIEVGIRP